MALSYRLQRFMVHTCTLYRETPPSHSGTGDPEAADVSYSYSPSPFATGVVCHHEPTPEFDQPSDQGLTKETNLLTSDKWHFLQGQFIEDTILIVMTTPGHPLFGHCWVVQGNSFPNASAPGRQTDSQWVFAKLAPTNLIPS